MADAVAQKDNLDQARKSGLLISKRFEVVLSNANNEPLLTLDHLSVFIGSITEAFQIGNDKVTNPDTSVLKIIAGSETITRREIKFAIDGNKHQDANITGRGLPYIKDTLYPEDVITIITYVREWLALKYEKETKTFSWSIQPSTLESEWQSAVSRLDESGITNSIADFSQQELRDAVEELDQKILDILESKTSEIKHDSIDEILDEIKSKFGQEPTRTWEDIGLVLTKSFAESAINTATIVIPNKNLKVGDVRTVVNTIFKEIYSQLEKTDEPKEPWDRASDQSKDRFSSSNDPYFSVNEIKIKTVTINDTVQADAFIRWVEQLLEELKKEPQVTEAETEETAAEDEEGGAGAEETALNFLVKEEIQKGALQRLAQNSGERFFNYFSGSRFDPNNLDQNQKDWLLTALPSAIQERLESGQRNNVISLIDGWISSNIILESEESSRYKISNDQINQLDDSIAVQFFADQSDFFQSLVESVPSVEELKDSKPVQAETPPSEAVIPDIDKQVDGVQVSEGIDRNKFISETATVFIALHFDQEGDAFRQYVYDYLAKNSPENITAADKLRLRLKLFSELQLDEGLFDLSKKYYEQRLVQLGIDDDLTITNLYNTLDSLLILVEDPHEYLAGLSEQQLIEHFALEGTSIRAQDLKNILLGLMFVRRAHYYINNATPIRHWYGKDQGKQKLKNPQYLNQLRSFISKSGGGESDGENGVMALNLNENEINKSTIDAHRKETIKSLYRELWIQTVAGKSPEELMDIYLSYGVDVIEIDFMKAPVPDGFGLVYSELVQDAYNQELVPEKAQKFAAAKQMFSNLSSEAKKKLGKAALLAIAPELAPILAAAAKIPILGAVLEDADEKIGDLLMKVGGVLTAGAAVLIGILARSVGAVVGAVVGGTIGGIIGSVVPVIGTGWGIGIGAGIGSGIGHGIGVKGGLGKFFKGFGGGGSGTGTFGAGVGLGGPLSPISTVTPNMIAGTAIGGTAVAATITASTITGGALQHPVPTSPDIIPDAIINESKYVELSKEADITKLENNQAETITYTITITPKDEYIIKVNTAETSDEWSYLGGDPLNLPDQTQDILDQIGEEPISEPITITYSVEMSGVDVAVNNNFTLSFEVVDDAGGVIDTDSLSAFETVIIGEPEIGCLVPGPGGGDWSGTRLLDWPNSSWNRLLNVVSRKAGTSTMFMSHVCAGDTPLEVHLLKGGFAEGYGGWAPSDFGGSKVGIYEYGMSFTDNSLEYTMVHELGHIIDYRNSSLRSSYLSLPGGDSGCYTYPFPSMCSGAEAFAESIALYVVYKSYYFSYTGHGYYDFKGNHPAQYEWLKDNVFGGVEF